MDLSKLSAADRRMLMLAGVAIIGGIVAVIDSWGIGGILGLLGALAAAFVILQPQLAPTVKLPMPKSQALLGAAAIAAVGFLIGALQYLRFALDVLRPFSILYDIGLVAAVVLAYLAWTSSKSGAAAPPAA